MTFFILGTHPDLSRAEILALIGDVSTTSPAPNILLTQTDEVNPGQLLKRLAGAIKAGAVIGELRGWNRDEAADLIAAYAGQATGKEKISYGISVYAAGNSSLAGEIQKNLTSLGLEVKKRLKEYGRPIRFVTSKDPTLSAVVIEKNGLLSSGGEFVLFPMKDKVLIAQTAAVQDFEGWSLRDYGRPARDAKSGMLPPKLARMMINLAKKDPSGTILDPFCGSGTVLMEAALMEFPHIIGSDISEKATKDSEKNLLWVERTFDLPDLDISLYTSPAEELNQHITEPVDLIVTETYLGPPRNGRESEQELAVRTKDLARMYEAPLKVLRALLKPDGVAVIAFPAYLEGEKTLFLPIETAIKTAGFAIADRFLYARKGQFVARDILVLQPIGKRDGM